MSPRSLRTAAAAESESWHVNGTNALMVHAGQLWWAIMHTVISLEHLDPDLRLLTLDRPAKRNALTRKLIEQLTLALRDAARDPTVRGVILNGAGKSFCAGVDLHELHRAPSRVDGA